MSVHGGLRLVRHAFVLAALGFALLAAAGAPAHAAEMCLGSDIDTCGEQHTYGSGQGIFIAYGTHPYIAQCAPGGVNDEFGQAAVKIFIVAAGASNGQALTDVGGSPSVSTSGLSGGYFDDFLIGTAGSNIPTGTYDVVYDECMDDKIDGDDTIFPNAITVTPPEPGQIPQIDPAVAKIKADAQLQADGWRKTSFAWSALNTALDAYEQASCLMDIIDCYFGPDALLGYFTSSVQSWLGVDDPKEAATIVLGNTVAMYQGIANDPPDANFRQATTLPKVAPIAPRTSDPTSLKAIDMVNGAGAETATAEALLHAVERYQGARNAGDPQWALQQARTIKSYASQLSSDIGTTDSLLQGWHDAVAADPRNADYDKLRDGLRQQRASIKANGFSPEQLAGLHNAGLTPAQIDALRTELLADDGLDHTRTALDQDVAAQVAAGQAAKAKYDGLVQDAQAAITTLAAAPANQGDDGLGAVTAGGPYTATQGQQVALAATCPGCAGALAYAWDTDGDGQFDDATGASPSVAVNGPDDLRVGVRVTRTDADDSRNSTLQGVAYADVAVTPANHAPVVERTGADAPSPADTTIVMHRGAAQPFAVHPADQDAGQTLSYAWKVDDAAPATGTGAFSHTFAQAAPLGLHHVTATVKDSSGLSNDTTTRVWNVLLQEADGDGDGWGDSNDCAPADATVNPGANEVPNNGKDDDCDTSTPDTAPADTVLDAGPAATTTETSATFAFHSVPVGATFECRLDAGAFAPCTTLHQVTGLAVGSHTFQVRAVNASGDPDTTPVVVTWVVQAPPVQQPNDQPGGTTTTTTTTAAAGTTTGGGSTDSGGTGAAGPAGTGGASSTPVVATKPADPCAGKKGKALVACQADQKLKTALASCAKLKGAKKATCAKRAKAVRKCATLTGKKATSCRQKAARIRVRAARLA